MAAKAKAVRFCPTCNRPLEFETVAKTCGNCGKPFQGSPRAQYCRDACRVAAHKRRKTEALAVA